LKKLGYSITRGIIKSLLHLYFGKIEVHGISNVPKGKPVLFLPNHQNAFLDTILIATQCNRSPFFLTRSDVFKSAILKGIFTFCKMIPIYRMRDGINSLKHNQQTFDICSKLLKNGEAVVIFPEANHNLERRVRPLSKGFTRILLNTLEKYPTLDIQLVPVGLNYKNAANFPDRASVYYGKPIALQELYDPNDENASITTLKNVVSENLKKLTTHIDLNTYIQTLNSLTEMGADFLNPIEVNTTILNLDKKLNYVVKPQENESTIKLKRIIFNFFNFPMLLVWSKVKLKIKEVEFKSTFRFAFGVLFYPIYLALLFAIFSILLNMTIATIIVSSIFLYNLIYTKTN
tara:strand:- start:444 stop:1481 length:1038 start_codon:yes stop_codon:yes gene_type:complete